MHITNYQMHNVLKVYTNHLSKDKTDTSGRPTLRKPNSDRVRISAEGKRQNLIDRVAADIVARITKEGIGDDAAPAKETASNYSKPPNRNTQFEYNVMQGGSGKETNKLSVENAGFLIRRIEELAGGPDSGHTDMTLNPPDEKSPDIVSDES